MEVSCITNLFDTLQQQVRSVSAPSPEMHIENYEQDAITGDRSAWRGPSSHSERPVGREVQHTGPTPKDRFSPALYRGHFDTFAKTPPP